MPDETTTTETTETTPENSGQQAGGQSFTQADVDRIIGERLKRAESAAMQKLLEKLGAKDEDELTGIVKAQRERDESEKTELQKLQDKLTAAEQKVKEAEERAAQAEQQRRVDNRNAAIIAALKDAEHPADVLLWLEANAKDELDAVMSDDGTLDEKKIAALVTKARKERPNFFRSGGPGSPSDKDGRVPDGDPRRKQEAAEVNRRHIRSNF